MQPICRKEQVNAFGITYANIFSDATLAAATVLGLGSHLTTRFGSARMGEWILISYKKENCQSSFFLFKNA